MHRPDEIHQRHTGRCSRSMPTRDAGDRRATVELGTARAQVEVPQRYSAGIRARREYSVTEPSWAPWASRVPSAEIARRRAVRDESVEGGSRRRDDPIPYGHILLVDRRMGRVTAR